MKSRADGEHMSQLDGLRAFAFAGVAVSHWTPSFLNGIVPWGTGVQLFFVLSGFLITGILLRNRPDESGASLGVVLRTFYARRILRIFPLYYGVLALAFLFSLGTIHQTWPWHVSYLSNFLFARFGHASAVADPYLHFWSLAVEEQFYLVWPWVVLVAPRRFLTGFLYASLIGAVSFRIAVAHLAPQIVSIRYLTPCCFDGFAVGGLIAKASEEGGLEKLKRLSRIFAVVGIAGLLVATVMPAHLVEGSDSRHVGHTFLLIFYGAIVARAAVGFSGPVGWVLSAKPIVYLGTISYGLYVFHYFAPMVADRAARFWHWPALTADLRLALPFFAVFTLFAAMLSWHGYERPLLRFKRRVPYPRGAAA
jgi:peptidoglycan/LPS O-acetylase OafA/YrhL